MLFLSTGVILKNIKGAQKSFLFRKNYVQISGKLSEDRGDIMKVTRADVAKLAGVSTATVSYVLNNSRSMSEKTRQKVLDAVEQLNYKPDMIARSMTTNETMQLSVMVNDISNPFYGEIIVGFETAAIEKGYFVNVCTGYKDINNYLDNYIARRIDGVFVATVPHKFNLEKLYNLTENGIKVVVSGNTEVNLRKVSAIENDYVTAMEQAVNYLHRMGHEKIAYLSGLGRKHSFDRRIEGYLEALKKEKIFSGDELLVEGEAPYATGIEDGYRLAKALLERKKEFTAIICTNDLMAMGAMSALEDAGIRVPENVSVIGFDDNLFSKNWRPSLTTMSVAKYEFGRKAFELLYNNIKSGNTGYYLSNLELKERDSVRKIVSAESRSGGR